MTGMNRSTGSARDNIEHLAQSIADILTTPIGSRVARRTYGSLLPELVDQPDNGTTRVRLYAATAGALMRWEPRLRVSRITLARGESAGRLQISIDGIYERRDGVAMPLQVHVPLQLRAAV